MLVGCRRFLKPAAAWLLHHLQPLTRRLYVVSFLGHASLYCPNHQHVCGSMICSGVTLLFSEAEKDSSSLLNPSTVKLKGTLTLKHNQSQTSIGVLSIPTWHFVVWIVFISSGELFLHFQHTAGDMCSWIEDGSAVLKILGRSPVLVSRPEIWSARASVWTHHLTCLQCSATKQTEREEFRHLWD